MKTFITRSRRLRGTPFISRLEKQGVKSFTVYNHMLLPTTFSSPEEEYIILKNMYKSGMYLFKEKLRL